jgi:beta-1,2-mannobiose phosphorylase / 1,2-beta-oligomannan phosphorylase
MSLPFVHSKQLVFEPQPGSPWADEMVLNPAIIQDAKTDRIHMLFRATGPWTEKQLPGKPLPYPIFLGYAYSDDSGKTWHPDFSQPALKPALEYDIEKMYIKDTQGNQVVNYANGCVEDPRLFYLEDKCYVIVACRMLPPGPYWIHDDPIQCSPDWIKTEKNPFGKAAKENVTCNVLYQVNLEALSNGTYDQAFQYVTQLTNHEYGENRDVLLFPEKLLINGKSQYVCLHRPYTPNLYPGFDQVTIPSIMICAADSLESLHQEETSQTLVASPLFDWEVNRIGGSTPPLRISEKEWLLNYHGKQGSEVGYTQSFMILEEQSEGLPIVKHRCPDRLLIADQPWEMPHKFKTPCVFTTGMIDLGEDYLLSYGAADEKVGICRITKQALLDHVRQYDAEGQML